MNPLDFQKLFNFSDTTQIENAILLIEKLNKAFDTLVNASTKRSKDFADSMGGLLSTLDKLEKQLDTLDGTNKKQQEGILRVAQEVDKSTKKFENQGLSLKEEEALIKKLVEAQEKLKKANEALRKGKEADAGSMAQMREEVKKLVKEYELMGNATDKVVKDAALQKIKTLSRTIIDTDQALKAARRGVDIAAGSYYDLQQRVNDATRRLKEMKGGIGNNTEEFKKLQKEVREGNEALKKFDESIGKTKDDTDDYSDAIDALDERMGGLISTLGTLYKQFTALAKHPFFITLAVLVGLLSAVTSAVKTFFTTTGEGEDILQKQAAVWDAFFITLRKGWSDVGKAAWDFFGADNGLKGVLTGILATYAPGLLGTFMVTASRAEELVEFLQKLSARMIEVTISRARRELAMNELLEKSANQLLYTDQERLNFRIRAAKIQEGISQQDIALKKQELDALRQEILLNRENVVFLRKEIDFSKEGLDALAAQINASGMLGEEKQKLADAVAEIIAMEAQQAMQARKNSIAIINMTLEIEKRKREAAKRERDAELALQKFQYEITLETNRKIIEDENTSFEQRKEALEQMTVDRADMLMIEKEQEIDIIEEAARERIRAEGGTYALLEKMGADYLEIMIGQDQALQDQRRLINEKYMEMNRELNRQLAEDIQKQLIRSLEQELAKTSNELQTATNENLKTLNNQYRKGIVSLREYTKMRDDFLVQNQKQLIMRQIDILEQELKAFEGNAQKKAEIEKKLSDLRLKLSDMTTQEIIAAEREIQAAAQELGNQTLNFIIESYHKEREMDIQRLEEKIALEEESKNKRIAIVADDAQARAFIENDFYLKQKAIERQIAEEKRKQAIFDKAVGATTAFVQTAMGVTRALGSAPPPLNFALAALVGAAGAVQIARILSAPIPAYARGVQSSPEGWALTGEKGRELAVTPKGELVMHDKPAYRYLEQGTTIIPNSKTESLMSDASKYGMSYLYDQVGLYDRAGASIKPASAGYSDGRTVGAIDRMRQDTVAAIKSQDLMQWDEYGYRKYTRRENARVQRLDDRTRFK